MGSRPPEVPLIPRHQLLACALLLAPLAAPAEAPAPGPRPWPALRWGMTEAEVLRALPGQAVRLDPVERLADGRVVSVGLEHVALGGVDFRARFVFAEGRLAVVSLKNRPEQQASDADHDRLKALLTAELGPPAADARESSVVDYRQVRWDAPGERVDLKYIPGQLVLQRSPPAPASARP